MNAELLAIPVDGGSIAVEVAGTGSLVLCVPGMGELRSSFRHLVPGLIAAGHRVATMDLRGHGESSLFEAYGDEATADDILVAVETLGGGPVTIIGNSMGAAAAVIAAARRPETVDRIVLVGPFVRDPEGVNATAMRIALMKPWGPAVWRQYHRRLIPTGGPADQAEHTAAVHAALRRPGRWRAFQLTAAGSHDPAEAALSHVRARTLVIMGEKDADWPDPAAEAAWVGEQLRGEVRMIPDAGHYPMAEQADAVLAELLPFLHPAQAEPSRG